MKGLPGESGRGEKHTKPQPHSRDDDNNTSAMLPARSLRILVVENHPDTRQGLDLFLKMLGHQVRFAENMQAALLLAADSGEEFDLLLSDIFLPDGNGWELLRQLDQNGHRPPHAFAMSGVGSNADVAKSEAAGFEKHLIKPFRPDELETALQAAAAGKEKRTALPDSASPARR